MRGFNYKKAVQALNYLATQAGGTINKMKALKLIWLSDRLHIRKYGRTITGDDYYALKNGLIPSATRDILESNDFISDTASDYSSAYIVGMDKYNYRSSSNPNLIVFSETDSSIIELVFSKYGHLDHFELSELSHKFPEWKKYESPLEENISSRFSISVIDFFDNIDDGFGLFIDDLSELQLSKDIYMENCNTLSLFK